MLLLQLETHFECEMTGYANDHREYRIKCRLTKKGEHKGEGYGLCSTKEAKYKSKIDNIADLYNTVLKMAEKRSLVDAVLKVGGISDMFTQDIEESNNNKKNGTNAAIEAVEKKCNDLKQYLIRYSTLLKDLLNEYLYTAFEDPERQDIINRYIANIGDKEERLAYLESSINSELGLYATLDNVIDLLKTGE